LVTEVDTSTFLCFRCDRHFSLLRGVCVYLFISTKLCIAYENFEVRNCSCCQQKPVFQQLINKTEIGKFGHLTWA